jgi:hypothetical protein
MANMHVSNEAMMKTHQGGTKMTPHESSCGGLNTLRKQKKK